MKLKKHIWHVEPTDRCPACEELFSMAKRYSITLNREFDTIDELAEIFAEVMSGVDRATKDEIDHQLGEDNLVGVGWDIERI